MPPAAKTQSRSLTPTGERLQKVLAAAGKGSRRECEEIILAGRVEVDRKVITELGTRVDTAEQVIRVDGERLTFPKRVYYAVNKPKGVVSTSSDPSGRTRVIDLVNTIVDTTMNSRPGRPRMQRSDVRAHADIGARAGAQSREGRVRVLGAVVVQNPTGHLVQLEQDQLSHGELRSSSCQHMLRRGPGSSIPS